MKLFLSLFFTTLKYAGTVFQVQSVSYYSSLTRLNAAFILSIRYLSGRPLISKCSVSWHSCLARRTPSSSLGGETQSNLGRMRRKRWRILQRFTKVTIQSPKNYFFLRNHFQKRVRIKIEIYDPLGPNGQGWVRRRTPIVDI